MMRRPPGPVAQQRNNKLFLAFAVLLIPFLLVEAQQQQQQQQHQLENKVVESDHLRVGKHAPIPDHHLAGKASRSDEYPHRRHESPLEAERAVRQNAGATVTRGAIETPVVKRRSTTSTPEDSNGHTESGSTKKNRYYEDIIIPQDESALATLAPDLLSVRAPATRRHGPTSIGAGLVSPHTARSLADWEVEDFVIMATVDGDLYACNRHTGRELWHHKLERPMVDIVHHRANVSVLDDDYSPIDHYIWIVEPTLDGRLYFYIPNTGLVASGLTIKELVEKSPHGTEQPAVFYAGKKESSMFKIDVTTGRSIQYFGSTENQVVSVDSCMRPNNFMVDVDGGEECGNSGTIAIGRADYTIGISNAAGRPIATIKFWEWTPNNYDHDLISQYRVTLDNQYIVTGAKGAVWGFDRERALGHQHKFKHTFRSSVARVFDVLRPAGAPPGSSPDLKVIPQPPIPSINDAEAHSRTNMVFLNRTLGGGWYALGGVSYPLLDVADEAVANKHRSSINQDLWEKLDSDQLAKLLVGKHSLNRHDSQPYPGHGLPKPTLPSLPDGSIPHGAMEEPENSSTAPHVPGVPLEETLMIAKVKGLPQTVAGLTWDFLSNPIFIIMLISGIFYKHHDLRRYYNDRKAKWVDRAEDASSEAGDKADHAEDLTVKPIVSPVNTDADPIKSTDAIQSSPILAVADGDGASSQPKTGIDQPAKPLETSEGTGDSGSADGPSVRVATPIESSAQSASETSNEVSPEPEKKKKAHRGRRAGAKHRKKKREGSVSRDDEPAIVSVNEIVDQAKKLGEQQLRLEPDIHTVINDVQDLTGPIYRMGSLEVNEDQQLGTGSNGTVVFAGRWDGRDVAVKRMLIQFYDIASQETRLLRESDDHPNVIRYYAQQQRAAFLYIALELCQASLADVIEKPMYFRDLAQAGERDLPNVLYQITNGLSHLHSLRIVHRDLKPQNILVNMSKDGKPRLLVSDFGLCKKLEGGQSSFGATTAHAAGTTGWRAPELLLDDDARDNLTANQATMIDSSSTHSGSGSALGGTEAPNRRATRAIDIFSLGLVFFYVLTKGSHPYDKGDRYMREVNIRKGSFDLGKLDVLGDYAQEARDVVERMLSFEPSDRPTAKDVMKHPFFWSAKKRLAFLCDVSDHFEKEQRDPPSYALQVLEDAAPHVIRSGDFLRQLPRDFVDSLGRQRKYTGSRMLDLLRALRNKRNHYEDMPDSLKKVVGSLPEGYLSFWTTRFENLLIVCWGVVRKVGWEETDRFRDYYEVAGL
ncbi:IRE protein kinase [Gaeumannomyces tritici R3-111a-1]|uniref:non-specific serine/threonine protein kinase n=1 Tax=Gaeumannomyces tritici (strain R3-111a-1) TaxID=644352 RepID=J3PC27_GAET3|nr:IRE protein kinase [Gaeumannomyces tritici R3-111a-1]EJT71797.1 IRE protein kinase [Gaeumannomyces tritici R3-111a-1]